MSVSSEAAQIRELQWAKGELEKRCLALGITLDQVTDERDAALARIEELSPDETRDGDD